MRELTCVVCPIGCRLAAKGKSDKLTVTGNRCPRGQAYAAEEIRAPKRVLTATCALGPAGSEGLAGACSDQDEAIRSRLRRKGMCEPRRLPVKSSRACPKERLNEMLTDLYAVRVKPPVKLGDIILADWKGTGIDILAARTYT
ncbi:MAG: DUF1667 domain-containing protein [Treponemataceae bacterium]